MKSLVFSDKQSKPTDIHFTMIYNREKHKILTVEKLESKNVWRFCLKNNLLQRYLY